MDAIEAFSYFGEELLASPTPGAVTDYEQESLLNATTPNILNAWTHVIPVLAKFAKHEGKRSLWGRDKGEIAYNELVEKLRLVVLGLYGDGLLSQGGSAEECLLELLNSLVDFKRVYPNWDDAYSAGYKVFIEQRDSLYPMLKKHQESVEAELVKRMFFPSGNSNNEDQKYETANSPDADISNKQQKAKDLREKAKDAPIALRILMDTIRARLERDFPQVISYPQWSNFVLAGTVAGTVALALRLHFDVTENQRTPLELEMREVLQKRFPQSAHIYEECYEFLTESLMEIPRPERGKHIFVLLGLWVVAVMAEGVKVEKEEWIVGLITEALQNETTGFWTQPYP